MAMDGCNMEYSQKDCQLLVSIHTPSIHCVSPENSSSLDCDFDVYEDSVTNVRSFFTSSLIEKHPHHEVEMSCDTSDVLECCCSHTIDGPNENIACVSAPARDHSSIAAHPVDAIESQLSADDEVWNSLQWISPDSSPSGACFGRIFDTTGAILISSADGRLPGRCPERTASAKVAKRSVLDGITLAAIRTLEQQLPLPDAAATLGVTPAELRRACRSLGITRWQHRAHAAAAAAAAAPELRAVAYAANLRRRYRSAAGPPGER